MEIVSCTVTRAELISLAGDIIRVVTAMLVFVFVLVAAVVVVVVVVITDMMGDVGV